MKSFLELYRSHREQITSVAFRFLLDPKDVEDVVQETLIEVWRRAEQFDPARGSESAWVRAIAHSRAVDRLRLIERSRMLAEQMHQDPAASPVIVESVDGACDRAGLLAAIRALPVALQGILELAYLRGLSHREIALQTATPLGTVKTRLRIALDRLHSTMADSET